MKGKFLLLGAILLVPLILTGCLGKKGPNSKELILATTTSIDNSGLLDEILPLFEKRYHLRVKPVAVGSGQALSIARRGGADVLLVHAPRLEKSFLASGYGTERKRVMHNYFIIVGPPSDPVRIKGISLATQAFKKIYRKAPFISRGDGSGTQLKEKEIWQKLKLKPQGSWYLESGQGMSSTLRIANQKKGYTLTDKGTFLSQKNYLNLQILSSDKKFLLNPYSVIATSPKKVPRVNYEGARKFIHWITSPKIQKIIGEFGKEKYGESLFYSGKSKE